MTKNAGFSKHDGNEEQTAFQAANSRAPRYRVSLGFLGNSAATGTRSTVLPGSGSSCHGLYEQRRPSLEYDVIAHRVVIRDEQRKIGGQAERFRRHSG